MNKISRVEEKIQEIDLKNIESTYTIVFPEDYKIHMVEFNGGRAIDNLFYKPNIWETDILFFNFIPIKHGTYHFEMVNDLDEFPEKQLVIGLAQNGDISMSFQEKEYGAIYICYSDGELHKLADSFNEFIEGLESVIL